MGSYATYIVLAVGLVYVPARWTHHYSDHSGDRLRRLTRLQQIAPRRLCPVSQRIRANYDAVDSFKPNGYPVGVG